MFEIKTLAEFYIRQFMMFKHRLIVTTLFLMVLNGYFLVVINVDFEYQKKTKINTQYLKVKLKSKQRELFRYKHQRTSSDTNEIKFKHTDSVDMIYYYVSSSGLSLQSFSASTAVKSRSYTELPVELSAHGTYPQLINFLGAMTALDSVMTWHDFSIEHIDSSRSDDQLLINMNAKIYKDNSL